MARPFPDLGGKYGTGALDEALVRVGLVDELRGRRLFEGIDTSSLHLELIDVRKLGTRSAILTCASS